MVLKYYHTRREFQRDNAFRELLKGNSDELKESLRINSEDIRQIAESIEKLAEEIKKDRENKEGKQKENKGLNCHE